MVFDLILALLALLPLLTKKPPPIDGAVPPHD